MKSKRELIMLYSDMVESLKITHQKMSNSPIGISEQDLDDINCNDKTQFHMNALMEFILDINEERYKERFAIPDHKLIPFGFLKPHDDTFNKLENINVKNVDECTDEELIEFIKNGFVKKNNMNRIEEIQKRIKKSDNILLFDKHEIDSLKKITKTTKISDYEVLTDDGFVDIEALHETIPYYVYHLKLSDGKELKCADNHIVFKQGFEYEDQMCEVFVKNLKVGDKIMVTDYGDEQIEGKLTFIYNSPRVETVLEITNLGYEEVMYDLELKEGSKRRYYTNGILSHNTMLAKLLAEHVYGDSDALVRMDMSEYMEKHSVSRMVGAPPGYVGYEQGGQLTEKVRRKPHCVILFDEIEKAHEDVFNLLLQLLDEGHLTDGLGRKVNFRNALIIMTSNIGVKEVNSFGKSLGFETAATIVNEENKAREIIEKALKKKFRPEFLNRIDEAIIFRGLAEEDIHKIIYLEVESLEKRLNEMNFKLKISKEAVEYLAKQGYDEAYGARPLARAIQHYVEDAVADEILNGTIKEGETISIDFIKDKEEITVKGVKSKSK